MKKRWIGAALVVAVIFVLLVRPSASGPSTPPDPARDARKAINLLHERMDMIDEQASFDARAKFVAVANSIYDAADEMKDQSPGNEADRLRFVHAADAYQDRIDHPTDQLVRRRLLEHRYQWSGDGLSTEQVSFDDSGTVKGDDFFKDAQWDVLEEMLFINHIGWAARLWYDPQGHRFVGQLIRDKQLTAADPGNWLWFPTPTYSLVEARPLD